MCTHFSSRPRAQLYSFMYFLLIDFSFMNWKSATFTICVLLCSPFVWLRYCIFALCKHIHNILTENASGKSVIKRMSSVILTWPLEFKFQKKLRVWTHHWRLLSVLVRKLLNTYDCHTSSCFPIVIAIWNFDTLIISYNYCHLWPNQCVLLRNSLFCHMKNGCQLLF